MTGLFLYVGFDDCCQRAFVAASGEASQFGGPAVQNFVAVQSVKYSRLHGHDPLNLLVA